MMHESVDHAFGALAWLTQRRVRGTTNTHARMAFYESLPRGDLFPAPPARIAFSRGRTFRMFGFQCENLTFESPHVPLHPDEISRYFTGFSALHHFLVRRVRRPGEAPRRAVVYLHPWMVAGAHAADVSFAAQLSRQLDCDVYNVEQVHHGQRQIPCSVHHGVHFLSADLALTLEAIRQAVTDARAVVRHLLTSDGYDEVGMVGVSLGAAVTSVVACLEPELSFAVPIVGHVNIADVVSHSSVAVHLRHTLRQFGVPLEEVARMTHVLAGEWLEPALERERMLFMPATRDTCMRPEAMRDQLERWGCTNVIWLEGGHITGLLGLNQRLPEVRAFLDRLPRRPTRRGETMPPHHASS